MQIDIDQRRVTLSVRELAEFRTGPRDGGYGRGGRWRTEAGQQWHKELQAQVEAAHAESPTHQPRFEVTINGTWLHKGWQIILQGRIDQIVETDTQVTLREVKTVQRSLPERPDTLAAAYPEYFAQLATYRVLVADTQDTRGRELGAELVFVDINSGAVQVLPLDAAGEDRFTDQIERLWVFLESRRLSCHRLASVKIAPPFETPRAGQEFVSEALTRASGRSPVVLFEAPTGFGKTAYALHFALNRMQQGKVDRVIFLTGKSTGQLQVVHELSRSWGDAVRFYQMRSKAEHAIDSPLHSCGGYGAGCRHEAEERWAQACIDPSRLLEEGPPTLEEVRALGERTGICPFEISRSILPYAEIWIGDYNYIFNPRTGSLFLNQPAFDPARTLLLIDEAHNLSARVADGWSGVISVATLHELLVELSFASAPAQLRRSLEAILDWAEQADVTGRMDLSEQYHLRDLLEAFRQEMQVSRLDTEVLRPGSIETLWELADLLYTLEHEHLQVLLWVPERGRILITCLDASWEIGRLLKSFQGSLLMSATISPIENFIESCGMSQPEVASVECEAPWRVDAYSVVVDARPDTRFRTRGQYFEMTARTIADLTFAAAGPVAAFFPSYRYAEDIANMLAVTNPELRLAFQERGLDLAGQREFIASALISSDVIFLVLGSGFTEGVDVLGGKISHAIVVGPALPEVDPVQAARMDLRQHMNSGEAFRQVYQIPGMRKINQALGRLVRAPGQRAKVLLHCRRFAEASYINLLDPHFRPSDVIRKPSALEEWIRSD